jgi:hypothetical protein
MYIARTRARTYSAPEVTYIYIYIYIHIYTYIHIYIYIYRCIFLYIYVYMCIYMFIYVYIYLYMYIYVYMCIYVCVCVCVCIYIYIYIYAYIYICMYVCMYVYVHTCIHTYIHTYIHIGPTCALLLERRARQSGEFVEWCEHDMTLTLLLVPLTTQVPSWGEGATGGDASGAVWAWRQLYDEWFARQTKVRQDFLITLSTPFSKNRKKEWAFRVWLSVSLVTVTDCVSLDSSHSHVLVR